MTDKLCYNFSISSDLTQIVNCLAWIPDCDSHTPAILDFLLMLIFVLQWLSLNWEILIMFLSQFPLAFHQIHIEMTHVITQLLTILVLIGTVFVIA